MSKISARWCWTQCALSTHSDILSFDVLVGCQHARKSPNHTFWPSLQACTLQITHSQRSWGPFFIIFTSNWTLSNLMRIVYNVHTSSQSNELIYANCHIPNWVQKDGKKRQSEREKKQRSSAHKSSIQCIANECVLVECVSKSNSNASAGRTHTLNSIFIDDQSFETLCCWSIFNRLLYSIRRHRRLFDSLSISHFNNTCSLLFILKFKSINNQNRMCRTPCFPPSPSPSLCMTMSFAISFILIADSLFYIHTKALIQLNKIFKRMH